MSAGWGSTEDLDSYSRQSSSAKSNLYEGYKFDLLNRVLGQIHRLLFDQHIILRDLFKPLTSKVEDAREYLAVAELVDVELTALFQLYPIKERYSVITKVSADKPTEIIFGREFEEKRLNEISGGLYLLRGVACFLAGEFDLAIESLMFVSRFLKNNQEQAKLFIALSYLFLGRFGDASYFLNLSLGGLAGDLICNLASYYARKDFARIKAYIEKTPSRMSLLLKADPLVLYFYGRAVYALDRLDRNDTIFDLILKPMFEARLTMDRKYLFLDPLLKDLHRQFAARALEKEQRRQQEQDRQEEQRREEFLKIKRKASWDKVLCGLKELEVLGFVEGEEIPEEIIERFRRVGTMNLMCPAPRLGLSGSPRKLGSLARLSRNVSQEVSGGETGGSPFAVVVEKDDIADSPGCLTGA
jgi:hypothetical protein